MYRWQIYSHPAHKSILCNPCFIPHLYSYTAVQNPSHLPSSRNSILLRIYPSVCIRRATWRWQKEYGTAEHLKFQSVGVQFYPSRSFFRWFVFWEKALRRCLQQNITIKLDFDPELWSQGWQIKENTQQKEIK